jgi:hypothetical protein
MWRSHRSNMSPAAVVAIALAVVGATAVAVQAEVPKDYKGKPFEDAEYKAGPQSIPGKVRAAYYDLGGEGVAYHDTDPDVNHGSGELNKKPDHQRPESRPYIWSFREKEGVDVSYTKKGIDTKASGDPEDLNVLYVGWTHEGEWLKCTVDVKESGLYTIGAHMTSAMPTKPGDPQGAIRVDFSGGETSGKMTVATTTHVHKWNVFTNLGEVKLEKGLQVMTLRFLSPEGINMDYIEFAPKTSKPASPAEK